MAIETKSDLKQETIAQLQELIQLNIDSRDGFRHAAEQLDDVTLCSAFEQIAQDRDMQAEELARYVSINGEHARREGSVAASLHRTWIDIRTMLTSDDRYAMLAEVERGEDTIKKAYEDALKSTAGSAMNDVLLQQYSDVKATHDRMRDLRDACADCK